MSAPLTLPYLGLRPFREADEKLFFGREQQINAALRQLEDHAFLAVVGSSGSGKSSFVQAGLLPVVRQGFLLGTADWVIVVVRPGYRPYQRLARGLGQAFRASPAARIDAVETDLDAPEDAPILSALRRSDRGLFHELEQGGLPAGTHLMVVVDQFEEL